jgi:hypothetical protein
LPLIRDKTLGLVSETACDTGSHKFFIMNHRKNNPSYVSKSTTRMRIIYDDPYATDSSSDEKNHYIEEPMKRKRVVHEFAIPNLPNDTICLEETMTDKNKI